MKKIELKPCPFCGGEAEIKTEIECCGREENRRTHFVRCKMCGAKSPSQAEYAMHPDCCKIIVKNKWNKRAGDSNA